MGTLEQAGGQLAQIMPQGEGQTKQQLYQSAAAAAGTSGSLAVLRLLEASGAASVAEPDAAVRAAKDAAAGALHAAKGGDTSDAAAALRGWPALRPLVAAAWWDAAADKEPVNSFLAHALALMHALQPLAEAPAEAPGSNPFRRLLGVLAAELAFHAEVAQLVMHCHSQSEPSSSGSGVQQAAAGETAPSPAPTEQPHAADAAAVALHAGAGERAAGEALGRLRAGQPAAQVLCDLAPGMDAPVILDWLRSHRPAETLLLRQGAEDASEQLLHLASAVMQCAALCSRVAQQQPVLQQQSQAVEEFRRSLAALPERWQRLWVLNMIAALLQMNPLCSHAPWAAEGDTEVGLAFCLQMQYAVLACTRCGSGTAEKEALMGVLHPGCVSS